MKYYTEATKRQFKERKVFMMNKIDQKFLVEGIEKIYYKSPSTRDKYDIILSFLSNNLTVDQYEMVITIHGIVERKPVCMDWNDVQKWEYSIMLVPDILWNINRNFLIDLELDDEEDDDLPFDDVDDGEDEEEEKNPFEE